MSASYPDLSYSSANDVAHHLSLTGFAYLNCISAETFNDLCHQLGTCLSTTTIAINPRSSLYLSRPGPIPFHTDAHSASIVAWHCVSQDEADGATILLDGYKIVNALSRTDLSLLSNVLIRTPPYHSVDNRSNCIEYPLLSTTDMSCQLYYAPWLTKPAYDEPQRSALSRFEQKVADLAATDPITLRLRPQAALFIDNYRILHGRASLSLDSRRKLTRVWIQGRDTTT
jgi:hypothetical protein